MRSSHANDIAENAIGTAVNVGKTAVALAGIGRSAAERIGEDALPQLASAGRAALDSKAGGRRKSSQAAPSPPSASPCSSSPDPESPL